MAQHGGKRPGAGRKKGSKDPHTLEKEKVRDYLIQQVIKEREPLIKALIAKGKKGDVQALREIFDRVLGKVKETVGIESGELPVRVISIKKYGEGQRKS